MVSGMVPSIRNSLRHAYVVDAVRTPIGRYAGALSGVRPDDLAAHVIAALVERRPEAAPHVDQVIFGCTNQAGEDNRNVARMALLAAGLSHDVPAVTVNRLCGSGLEAVADAARMIATGEAECVIAGGVESMSRAPWVMSKPEQAFGRTPPALVDTTIGWRFPNPRIGERYDLVSLGDTAENVAKKHGISRNDQDRFALESHRRAAAAVEAGLFRDELVPVRAPAPRGDAVLVERDEPIRADTTLEKLAALKPAFRAEGTVTAGNSSPINDGAAALLCVSGPLCAELGLQTLARVVTTATVGVDPGYMGEGPIPAVRKLLKRAGLRAPNLDLVELNEAFAAQALACIRALELDPARVNVQGGAIALGHPVGCSGARIAVTLVHAMKRRDASLGMCALCVGVGQGIATLFERS
jgi:3-oxoadipyl-CoA thiolase